MKGAKGILGAALVAAGVAASTMATAQSGSYELMLAVDQTNKVIRRIDPITGTQFGSFGAGYLTEPSDVKVIGNVAYVLDRTLPVGLGNTRVRRFDYSTGLFLGATALPPTNWGVSGAESTFTLLPTGFLYADANPAGSTVVSFHTFDGAFGFFQGSSAGGFRYRGVAYDPMSGMVYRSGSGSIRWSMFGANFTNDAFVGSIATGALTRSMLRVDRKMYLANASAARVDVFDIASNGALTASVSIPVPGFAPDSLSGLAMGHGNVIYVSGQDGANPANGRIAKVDVATREVYGTVTAPGLGTVRGMDVVVAPEPGTLAALGLGALALLRRPLGRRGRVRRDA